VFKLLERGVYISALKIAVIEVAAAAVQDDCGVGEAAGGDDETHEEGETDKWYAGVVKGGHRDRSEVSELDQTRTAAHAIQQNEGQQVLYCDIIAFHAKKRHIYAIVVCDNAVQLQQCRLHALRVARSIRRIKPRFSTMIAFVLTVCDFEDAGTMRLCVIPPTKRRSCEAKHVSPAAPPAHIPVRSAQHPHSPVW